MDDKAQRLKLYREWRDRLIELRDAGWRVKAYNRVLLASQMVAIVSDNVASVDEGMFKPITLTDYNADGILSRWTLFLVKDNSDMALTDKAIEAIDVFLMDLQANVGYAGEA